MGSRLDRRSVSAARRIAILVAAVAIAACRKSPDYKIGVALGDEGTRAAELALQDLNSSSGTRLGLRQLRGVYGASAEEALQAAESLATDPTILGVVGHTNSSASIAASQVYNARHVVQIAPTTTSPLYSKAGPYSFRLVGSDTHQAVFLAQQVSAAEAKRVAIVYSNDDYGRSLRRLVVEELRRRGVRSVYEGPYAEGEMVGTDVVRALAAARPTILVWLGRQQFYSVIRTELRRELPTMPVLASDGFDGAQVHLEPQLFAGVRYVRLVNVHDDTPAMRALQRRYRDAGSRYDMTDQAVLTYDAVMLLGTAIHSVGPDRNRIRVFLDELGRSRPPFTGITGRIAFSPDGDREPTYVLVTPAAPGPGAVPR